jgi:5-methylcytosine-specific restriction endonuclease McrA
VRIFKAQKNGNTRLVRKLQKLLLSSKAAKLLAIRQVTQLNTGRKTAGVDGKKALEPPQRLALLEVLVKNWKQWKHQPLKRVYIPKADGTRRGLGIPTISDRAYQCLIKYALEPAAEAMFNLRYKAARGGCSENTIKGFRYADDVVFLLKPEDNADTLRQHIDSFLETRGLKVKEAKTKIVHSTDGFDFLGFNFIVKSNGKFISTPSQKAVSSIKAKVKEVMKDKRFNLEQRIDKCGSIVRGWRNYHRFCDLSKHNLWAIAFWTWKFIRKQGRYDRNQTNKVINRAFPAVKWAACRFNNVTGDKSPYDGDFLYWSNRENANYDGITARLLKKQNHKCAECNLSFFSGDIAELHHIDGNHDNWKPVNLEVLHRECHQHQTIHGQVRVRTAG